MTEKMSGQADRLANSDDNRSSGEFYGISTVVANVNIVDFSEGATGATIEVSSRRTETKGSGDPVIFSQTARLQLNKDGEAWKVDSFTWK